MKTNFYSVFGVKPIEPRVKLPTNNLEFSISELKEIGLENNPNIRSISFKLKSNEMRIKSLKRKQLPSVKLEAEAKVNEGYFRTDSEREVLSAYAKIDIPIYQSGVASSKIRETRKQVFAEKELLKLEKKKFDYNIVASKSTFDYTLSRIKAFQKQIDSNKIYLEGLKQELQLGERTTLDVLNGEQELLESELGLINAHKEYFLAYYEILFLIGKLNAKDLKLNVNLFDPEKNYNKVRGKWLDIIE